MTRMWRLEQFRFDDQIAASEVYLFDDNLGELVRLPRDEAIELAHARGAKLVAWWPDDDCCIIGKVDEPVRWETVEDDSIFPVIDESLWFESSCGSRDFLLDACGHTYPGRMVAWCPTKEVAYNVSLGEMGEMSREALYFIRGFLAGNEPGPPENEDGETGTDDLNAWYAATRRFRRTGSWFGRWGTCSVCGCVLLPDLAGDRCEQHLEA